MVFASALLVAGIISFAPAQPVPLKQPVKLYIFTQKTGETGLVGPDYQDRFDSAVDVRAGLYSGHEIKFTPVPKAEDAQVLVEILGRESDPKNREIRTVRVKVTAGSHVRAFEGHDDDGSWSAAANDVAAQIRRWVAANYVALQTAAGRVAEQAIPPVSGASRQPSLPPMTNADVVRLCKAGLGEEVVLNAIGMANERVFDLSTASLLELAEAGVPNRVIAEMQNASASAGAPAQGPLKPDPSLPQGQAYNPSTTRPSPKEIVSSARTLYVSAPTNGSLAVKIEISKKLREWAGLALVESAEGADLILQVEQTGKLNVWTGMGAQAAAVLFDTRHRTQLWTKTVGSGWSVYGWSIAASSRAVADDLIQFLTSAKKSPLQGPW